jgi:hypothetical protein
LFSLLALISFSPSLISSSDMDCEAWVEGCECDRVSIGVVLWINFFVAVVWSRRCLRACWRNVSCCPSIAVPASSPRSFASVTESLRSNGIGAWMEVMSLAWWAKAA